MRPALALGLAIVLAACGGAAETPSPSLAAATLPPQATPTVGPVETVGPPPSPTPPDEASPLVIDPDLLAVLPVEVAGVPVVESLDEATLALGDRTLQDVASAIDAAVVVDTTNGNLAYVLVVKLRPGKLGETAFRDWRDSFDEGACSAGGGVIGHAEAEMDGRRVYIGTCEGGFWTYHTIVAEDDLLISAWSLGADRFGELLISSLRTEA